MKFWQFALRNVIRNARAYFAYFLSSSFSITVFFSFAVYRYHPRLQHIQSYKETGPLFTLIGFTQFVIVLFSFFFLVYSIGTFLTVRKKQFGVLTILGISHRQLKRLIFLENMIIGLLSIFVGIQAGLVFSNFFLLITSKISGINGLYLYWPSEAIQTTVATFLILFTIVSIFTPALIRTQKIVHLLRGGIRGKKERSPSVIISIFSLLCLFSGYIFAAYPQSYITEKSLTNGIGLLIILAIIPLVTIGTYFLFSQASFLFIWILKKRRRFYMKKTNMLWISDLASRVRININMLFVVTMLSVITFTTITTLYAFNKYTKASILEAFPFPFTYVSYEGNILEAKHIAALETELRTDKFTYQKHKAIIYKDKAANEEIWIIKQSDYNILAKFLNRPQVQLTGHETYIVPRYSPIPLELLTNPFLKQTKITLQSNKKEFHIKEIATKPIIPENAYAYLIVLQDHAVDNEIPHLEPMAFYNFQVDDWENTLPLTKRILHMTTEDAESVSPHTDQQEEQDKAVPFRIFTSSDELYVDKRWNVANFFIGTFLGIIFFMGAGSVLYFRMYTDLTREAEKYKTITKIGLTKAEMTCSATIQLAILFFVPYVIASIHTIFAIKFIQSTLSFSLLKEEILILGLFGIIEIIFFFLIRSFYIQKLSQHIKL
ncbi:MULTISPECIES: FtsX-like permease family protein [unclassified Bacillus (in: firmicutes)]|uniref:FtsX-like permease family protein n=1 Tax=unclassified Bacillus (in: firmicutes) TaxID=185979 RepID=UPI0008DEFE0C|nr:MULTISPECIES: ABC transporter permease [unclassified Bacillus (in: firmicutes)]SFK14389.1 putative ABC transport system permease protein [Bacillus sp. 71mf]SFT01566.1 putative ABC transport system permease protein [Bacillus sp. 103mf]